MPISDSTYGAQVARIPARVLLSFQRTVAQGYDMSADDFDALREKLLHRKQELSARLERITANVRRGYQADSEERAKEMEDSEVVDALGNEAREEVKQITNALVRLDAGEYGICTRCGEPVDRDRLAVFPYAEDCIDCARESERGDTRRG